MYNKIQSAFCHINKVRQVRDRGNHISQLNVPLDGGPLMPLGAPRDPLGPLGGPRLRECMGGWWPAPASNFKLRLCCLLYFDRLAIK